jgi:hypothetical protein
MDGQSTEIAAPDLALAGVQSDSDFDTETVCCLDDFGCASNGSSRAVERGDEAVSGGIDLCSTKAFELVTYRPVVGVEDGAPAPVAERGRSLRGGDDGR